MKYKLYSDRIYNDPLVQILSNRGIEVENIDKWMRASYDDLTATWHDLDEDGAMTRAVKRVHSAIENNEEILIIVDSDADGFTSSAIFNNYLYKIAPDYVDNHIHFFLHAGKQHGLEDLDYQDDMKINLIVAPDSSSNDYKYHEQLSEMGIGVIVLDHHEAPHKSKDAIVVNNQLCNYKNKAFSGAGIVWRFCQAYDEIYNYNYANEFLDLCALGNLSDMMNYCSLETRIIIKNGLDHIKNPFFYYMVEKNQFSINKMNGINYMSIAFYVTPFINAVMRSGNMDEKQILLDSMLINKAFQEIESGKRGHKGELVPLVEEAVRIVSNVKARQTKMQDFSMALLEDLIDYNHLLDNAILVCLCEPGDVEKNLAGLAANKIQAKYQRPTLVLTKSKTEKDDEYYYRGSARNYGKSEIQDLRQLCLDTDLVEYAEGHAAAFGISIAESNIKDFIDKTNEVYKDISQEPVYWVDYIWEINDVNPESILTISNYKNIYGQEIPECYICLKKIPLDKTKIQLLSPDKHPTLKITLPNGLDIMKFKSSQSEYEYFTNNNAYLTAICTCNKNEWNGNVRPQLIIEEYEIQQEWVF